jgi:hypothetical protein
VPVQAGRYCTADPRRHCLNNQPEKGNSLDPFKGVELWVLPKLMLYGCFIIMDQPMQHILRRVLYLSFESKPACKQICTFVAASFTVHIPHLVARGLNCSAAGIAGPLSVMSLFGCSQDIGTLVGLETRFVSG